MRTEGLGARVEQRKGGRPTGRGSGGWTSDPNVANCTAENQFRLQVPANALQPGRKNPEFNSINGAHLLCVSVGIHEFGGPCTAHAYMCRSSAQCAYQLSEAKCASRIASRGEETCSVSQSASYPHICVYLSKILRFCITQGQCGYI